MGQEEAVGLCDVDVFVSWVWACARLFVCVGACEWTRVRVFSTSWAAASAARASRSREHISARLTSTTKSQPSICLLFTARPFPTKELPSTSDGRGSRSPTLPIIYDFRSTTPDSTAYSNGRSWLKSRPRRRPSSGSLPRPRFDTPLAPKTTPCLWRMPCSRYIRCEKTISRLRIF